MASCARRLLHRWSRYDARGAEHAAVAPPAERGRGEVREAPAVGQLAQPAVQGEPVGGEEGGGEREVAGAGEALQGSQKDRTSAVQS